MQHHIRRWKVAAANVDGGKNLSTQQQSFHFPRERGPSIEGVGLRRNSWCIPLSRCLCLTNEGLRDNFAKQLEKTLKNLFNVSIACLVFCVSFL